MEYNDITYSMHTLLIKWGCTPSKESNIVLVWCNCSPYHTLDFFGPRTFEKLVPTPLVEFQGWGPTLLSFFKAVRHWKLQWQVLRLIPVFSCSFHPCLGWRFHVTFPRWVEACWSQKMVEGWFSSTHDLCQLKPISRCIHSRQIRWHLEVPAFWSVLQWNQVVAITILSKDDDDNTVLVLVLLFPRFTAHTRQRKTFFLRTDWRKSSDIYQTSFAPCMLTILRSKSGMRWTQQA